MSSYLRSAQRWSYLLSRSLGDVNAAQRGRYGKRLARRQVQRRLVGPALNRLFR